MIGGDAGKLATDPDDCVLIGHEAGGGATLTGHDNTYVGRRAGKATTSGNENTFIGNKAGLTINTGADNTFIGSEAGDGTDDGTRNVAVGKGALSANCGNDNTAVGENSLILCTTNNNTAIGRSSGASITSGSNNTFVGLESGDGTDDGAGNVAIGNQSLSGNCANDNTCVGQLTMIAGTGGHNTCVGQTAGFALTSGNFNTFIGKDSGRTGSPGGNMTNDSNKIVLGDDGIAEAHIQVDWTVASDQRDKTDFTALDLGLNFVKALAPVTFKWDKRSKYGDKRADGYDLNAQSPDGTHKEDWLDIGFKAQEVEALEQAAGYNKSNKTNLVSSHTGDGKQMGLQYSKFVPILVKAIQEQNELIEALTARIVTLEG